MTLRTPPAFDGGDDLAEHLADQTGGNPNALGVIHTVPVTVVDEVTIKEFPPRTLTTEQIPLDTQLQQRILNRSRSRASVVIAARGGDIVIGANGLTAGTGFLVPNGTALTLEVSADVYALAIAATNPQTTAHILAQHRDG